MKIGTKIVLIVAVSVLGMVILSVFSINGVSAVNDMFNFCGDVPIRNSGYANRCLDNLNSIARATAMMILVDGDTEKVAHYVEMSENNARQLMLKIDSLKENVSEGGRPFVERFYAAVLGAKEGRIKIQNLLKEGHNDEAMKFRAGPYQDSMSNALKAADEYIEFADAQVMKYVNVDSEIEVKQVTMTMYIVVGIILAILITIAVIVITGITKPLKKAVDAAEKVAVGELVGIDLETTSKDETGMLLRAFQTMVAAIESLTEDASVLAKAAASGDLKVRADETKHKGSYHAIIAGVNHTLDDVVGPLRMAANYVEQIAHGITPPKITDTYNGDFNTIKNNLNTCIDALTIVVNSIETIARDAGNGILATRADASKVENTWSDLLKGINGIVENADNIIGDSGRALAIMATGDLTPRVTAEYKGKFGEMKDSINNLADSLTDLISQLQEAIHTTASASAEISSTADTLAAATQEQSSQTDEVATAMEEMSRTVTDNAHSATRTADVARQSGEVANNGGKVVQQTVEKMREIAAVVKMSADNIAKLGESSKKIGEIISVIDDIADQTNLLSLNAAIEAARAGEQGRGFAVVADSVGKLAVSTASATKEIADMIKGIQTDTALAVQAMEKGTSEVQSGIELADNAGNSLKDILSGINELLDMVNQIAAASEQQSATSEQISKNVSSISKVSADSARNVEDVATTANELARMTDTLTSLVSQFKVNVGGYAPRALESNF